MSKDTKRVEFSVDPDQMDLITWLQLETDLARREAAKRNNIEGVRYYEHPDPTPMAPPIGYVKQPSMIEVVRSQIEAHNARVAAEEVETFEEGEDFDVGDDYDPSSPWEEQFMPSTEEIRTMLQRAFAPASAQPTAPLPTPSPAGVGEGAGVASPDKATPPPPPGPSSKA